MSHSDQETIKAEFTKLGESLAELPQEQRPLAEAYLKGVLAGLKAIVGGGEQDG